MPQPIKDASVFFMKMILHDWSDLKCRVILSQLRDAAVTGKTRLLIMDRIVPYACKGTDPMAKDIPGLLRPEVPDVLPPNLGAWGPTTYHVDLNVSLPAFPLHGYVAITLPRANRCLRCSTAKNAL